MGYSTYTNLSMPFLSGCCLMCQTHYGDFLLWCPATSTLRTGSYFFVWSLWSKVIATWKCHEHANVYTQSTYMYPLGEFQAVITLTLGLVNKKSLCFEDSTTRIWNPLEFDWCTPYGEVKIVQRSLTWSNLRATKSETHVKKNSTGPPGKRVSLFMQSGKLRHQRQAEENLPPPLLESGLVEKWAMNQAWNDVNDLDTYNNKQQ